MEKITEKKSLSAPFAPEGFFGGGLKFIVKNNWDSGIIEKGKKSKFYETEKEEKIL